MTLLAAAVVAVALTLPQPTPEELVCSRPWPCAEALSVAWCESKMQPDAVSPDGLHHGSFQLSAPVWRPYFGEARWALVYEWEAHVAMAYEVYERAGRTWAPWECRP